MLTLEDYKKMLDLQVKASEAKALWEEKALNIARQKELEQFQITSVTFHPSRVSYTFLGTGIYAHEEYEGHFPVAELFAAFGIQT